MEIKIKTPFIFSIIVFCASSAFPWSGNTHKSITTGAIGKEENNTVYSKLDTYFTNIGYKNGPTTPFHLYDGTPPADLLYPPDFRDRVENASWKYRVYSVSEVDRKKFNKKCIDLSANGGNRSVIEWIVDAAEEEDCPMKERTIWSAAA